MAAGLAHFSYRETYLSRQSAGKPVRQRARRDLDRVT
jgi:hypothetical protein